MIGKVLTKALDSCSVKVKKLMTVKVSMEFKKPPMMMRMTSHILDKLSLSISPKPTVDIDMMLS